MDAIFHFNGREYKIYNALELEEIKALLEMANKRDKKLNPFNAKSTIKYFEDTDRMLAALLRRCFGMTDKQIAEMDEVERRSLGSAFIRLLASANPYSQKL